MMTTSFTHGADALVFAKTDGGRREAGFTGDAGDCVTRAIAVALDLPYREVYDSLHARARAMGAKDPSPRDGVLRDVYDAELAARGWTWTPTMGIGTGCTVHLTPDELPDGRIICRLSRHLVAVIDGVIHDTHDSSRGGTRCVYGYWSPSAPLA